MIPLRDTIPSRTYPFVTVGLIVINSLAFFYEIALGSYLDKFLSSYGVVPAKFFHLAEAEPWNLIDRFLPLFTSMFLHGGFLHVIGNMIYLWIFGDNVEDRFGHVRFLLFYLLCGVIAALAHIYINSHSHVPTIGASGAIAGVMGAYILLFPRSRVLTIIPIFFFFQLVEVPAVFFLGIWFLMQFFSGTFALAASSFQGGVAWWAHIGGFTVGFVVVLLFVRKRPRETEGNRYLPW